MAKYLPSAFVRASSALLSALALAACGTSVTPPIISGIDPNPAKPGSEITITGQFFGNPVATDGSGGIRPGFSLSIGGVALVFEMNNPNSEVRSWDGDNNIIVAVVPKDLKGTTVDVVVSTDAGPSIAYPLLLGESDSSAVVQPVIGWVLHDSQPMATLFQATAAGLPTVAASWTFSTSSFPDELSDATPVAFWDFDFGANWEVTLNDVSASLEQSVAYLSISALDVTAGVSTHFLRPFEGFMLENADGDLPTGVGPVRLGDWGPVVALGIGDQTVSHINSEAGTVAAIDYIELIDANFIALGVYGGVDEVTGLGYTILVGNTKLEGIAKMVALWQEPGEGEGAAATDKVLTVENPDWVLNGLVASDQKWNAWVVARHIDGCAEDNVYANCTGPDYVVQVHYWDEVSAVTQKLEKLVMFAGTAQMPAGAELRAIALSQGALYLPYAARATMPEVGDGVYMLRRERTNGFENILTDLLDGATVTVANPAVTAPVTDATTTRTLDVFDTYQPGTQIAAFDVTGPVQIAPDTYGVIQIMSDETAYPNWNASSGSYMQITVSGGGTVASYLPTFGGWAPSLNDSYTVTSTTYMDLSLWNVYKYNEIYFFPAQDQQYIATITVDISDGNAMLVTSTTFDIEVAPFALPTTNVPAAADLKKADGSGIVADPRDVYVIPETPLVLVSSHDENRIAVINSLQPDATQMWMHSFPSYVEGPTMLSCGVVKPAEPAQ